MLTHWNCEQCKGYNDILTNDCRLCNTHKPLWLTGEYQTRVEFKRGIFYRRIEVNLTEEEQLFAQFYNHEKVLVASMDITELREHRELLSKICLEAKARLVATDDEHRERKSKSGNKNFLIDVENNAHATDTINVVKSRKDRMSKLEKHRVSLLAMGMDKEIVDEMISKMEKKATEKSLKTVTFKVPNPERRDTEVQVEKAVDSKPFDASSVKFG